MRDTVVTASSSEQPSYPLERIKNSYLLSNAQIVFLSCTCLSTESFVVLPRYLLSHIIISPNSYLAFFDDQITSRGLRK